jgi:hypothetical protein
MAEIHKYIHCIWNKEELPHQWKDSIIVPIHKKDDKLTVMIIEESLLSTAYKILTNILMGRLTPYVKLLGIITMGSIVIYLLPIRRKFMTHLREKYFTIFCLNLVHLRR